KQRAGLARRDRDREKRASFGEPRRRRIERQRRGAKPVIQPHVVQGYAACGYVGSPHEASALAPRAAHLEDVGEVGIEGDLDGQAPWALVEISHVDALVAG